VRSTVGALTSANQQLGNVQGLLSTTQSGLNKISNTMASMRDVLIALSSGSVSGSDRTNYVAQYNTLLQNLKSFIQDANYNGKTLIGNVGGSNGTYTRVTVVRNEIGASYSIASYSGSTLFACVNYGTATGATFQSALLVASLIGTSTSKNSFIRMQNAVNNELNTIGSAINYVTNQISYNSTKIDSLNAGVGALVDANLAQESAQLQALQIRQQLGTQALSLANQAPQTLLSLFK
jgi:flagellin